MLSELLDLVLPVHCGGCGRAGTGWCYGCAAAFAVQPYRARPRVDPGVVCWHLGEYSGVRRAAVLAVKERGRRDLAAALGTALAAGLERLRRDGELPSGSLLLVPAPTRRAAARVRGGDPVTRVSREAAAVLPGARVSQMLRTERATTDSVGLSAAARRANLAGRVRLLPSDAPTGLPVVLVDDVLTTGATAAESVRVLTCAGYRVFAVVTLTAA